jgi:hypothetical protein
VNRNLWIAILILVVCIAGGFCGSVIRDKDGYGRRAVFMTSGGAVVFPHRFHVMPDGEVGAECTDCHHQYDPDAKPSVQPRQCRSCHYDASNAEAIEAGKTFPVHKRSVGANCMNCHDEDCGHCHRPSGK